MGGRTASYYDEDLKATVSYVEAAEFAPGPGDGHGPQARSGAAAGLHQEVPREQDAQERVPVPRLLLRTEGLQGGRRPRSSRSGRPSSPTTGTRSRATCSASSRTRTPSTRASPWPRSSRSWPAIPENPDYQESLATLYVAQGRPGQGRRGVRQGLRRRLSHDARSSP
ncbi:MAG: hypothetical protein MZV64_63045 [Ignavibacteriales bacterium]|nr:hypothetical protein [Ignavibacteriales bacterium]